MRTTGRAAAALLLAIALLGSIGSAAMAQDAAAPSSRVVVVLAPYITWADVTPERMPATAALAERSAVGNLNIRSSLRLASGRSAPSQANVVLTLSAGAPTAYDAQAPVAYEADQRLEVGTAAEIYGRSMGQGMGTDAIAYLGLPRILRANASSSYGSVPGALGQAVKQAGGTTAALGNSDGGYDSGQLFRSRPAALLAMDALGLVTYGDVSMRTLAEDMRSPYGLATDAARLKDAYAGVLRSMAEHGGPGLIVIDPGDPERAFNFAADSSPAAAEQHRVAAATSIDRAVALALELLPQDGTLMVVSTGQVTPSVGPSGFGPVIISGPGHAPGMVASPSTHRAGLMTDLDISATALFALGIDRPVEILGNAASSAPSAASLEARVRTLTTMNAMATSVDTVRPAVQNSYITLTVIVLLACAALLRPMQRARSRWGVHAARVFSHAILLFLLMPASATFMYVFKPRPTSPLQVAALFVLTTLALWAMALVLDRRWGSPVALAFVGLFSTGVLLADQALGAPLSFSGMFSYSPLLGARYYGIGNEGASVVVGGALAGLTMLLDAFRDRPWAKPLRQFGPIVLGVTLVALCAAPGLGANVGVVAWGTVAFAILWMHLNGHRITWKSILGIVVVVGLFIVAFSAFDLLGGSGGQTHLGRAWESAGSGGIAELWRIVARKAETNWRVLRATNWSILMVAILAFLGYMRWRPQGVFAEALERYPAFAVAMTASLWGSLVGYFTEDSGIVIPALVMLFITGTLLHAMLSQVRSAAREAGS